MPDVKVAPMAAEMVIRWGFLSLQQMVGRGASRRRRYHSKKRMVRLSSVRFIKSASIPEGDWRRFRKSRAKLRLGMMAAKSR